MVGARAGQQKHGSGDYPIAKLDELAHLRGLDRYTAVSVEIAQYWVWCFGLKTSQVSQ